MEMYDNDFLESCFIDTNDRKMAVKVRKRWCEVREPKVT